MPTINALPYNEQNRKPDVPTVKKVFISSKVSRFYCEGRYCHCQWVLDELLKVFRAIVKCVKVKSPLYSVTEISSEHSHIKNK